MIAAGSVLNERFQITKLIGRGGFAQVFLATDLVLKRTVAIKVLNAELIENSDDANLLARFQREAQAVAALDHPNILSIFDYGEFASTLFLVMPYVEGGTLHDRLREGRPLHLHEIRYFLGQVAGALDYAHRRHLVHRDIKPQNMLIRAEDGHLLLADFGIAKVLSGTSDQSRTGVVGTIAYMAPEQFQGIVGRTTDVYALGCVLFQMLTGDVPFSGTTTNVMFGHVMGPIPSLADRGNGRFTENLQPLIDRALAKAPEERFESASKLFEAFEIALASSGLLTAGDGAFVPQPGALTPPPISSPNPLGLGQRYAADLPRQTDAGRPAAVATGEQVDDSPTMVDPHSSPRLATPTGPREGLSDTTPKRAETPTKPGNRQVALWSSLAAIAALAVVTLIVVAVLVARGGVDTVPTATTIPFPGMSPVAAPLAHPFSVNIVAWAPDGKTLATGTGDGKVGLWTAEGKSLGIFQGHTKAVEGLAWSPDGTILASSSEDLTIRLWTPQGKEIATLKGHTNSVDQVAWSPDSQTLASASRDATVRLWSRDGSELKIITGHDNSVFRVAWSPDGTMLASGSADHTVRLWTPAGQPIATLAGHENYVTGLAWSPDSKTLASSSDDNTVRLWDAAARKELATLRGHTSRVWSVAWSPDGKTLASASWDKTVRLWTADGKAGPTLKGHSDFVYRVAWSPDGSMLASAGKDTTVRLWGADGRVLTTITDHSSEIYGLSWSKDAILATGSWDTTARLWRKKP